MGAIATMSYDPQYVDAQLLGWSDDRASGQSVMRMSLHGNRVESATELTAHEGHAARETDEDELTFGVQR